LVAAVNAFLKLFRSIEARQVAEEALVYAEIGWMKRSANYWSLAYNIEKHHRENMKRVDASEK
jgi:hypothetical protein